MKAGPLWAASPLTAGEFPLILQRIQLTYYRFNQLAWSAPSTTYMKGVLAAGMETGEVNVFDPSKIVAGARYV